jgi:peroxisomal membrane protein 2
MMRTHLLLLLGVFLPVAGAFQSVSNIASATTLRGYRTIPSMSSLQMSLDPQQAWTAYNDALVTDPLLVKSLTAGVILGAADLAGQALESAQKGESSDDSGIDVGRTARFAFFGLVLQAPWNHFYYQMLDGAIPPTADPWTPTTAVKTVIDQFVQAPIFTVLIFAFLGFLEGKNFEAVKKQLEDDYADTMVANWKLWVPATVVNLAFVPPILRVLYLNCVFFFWSIFLSLKLNKDTDSSSESV